MADIINNAPATAPERDGGIGVAVAIVVILILAILFFMFGLPALRSGNAGTAGDTTNVHVNLPVQGGTSGNANGTPSGY
jgi:hypothetical protein